MAEVKKKQEWKWKGKPYKSIQIQRYIYIFKKTQLWLCSTYKDFWKFTVRVRAGEDWAASANKRPVTKLSVSYNYMNCFCSDLWAKSKKKPKTKRAFTLFNTCQLCSDIKHQKQDVIIIGDHEQRWSTLILTSSNQIWSFRQVFIDLLIGSAWCVTVRWAAA